MFQSKKSHRLMAMALSAVVGLTATFAAAETVTPTGNTYGFAGTNARYYTDYMTLEEEQQIAKDLAIEVASEGFVLLQNGTMSCRWQRAARCPCSVCTPCR